MRSRTLGLVVALLCPGALWAQDTVPVIRARSKVVTVTDGVHVKKDAWYVMPEKSPDVYYVEIPLQPHTVTFTTDVESRSFPVVPGAQHDFVVRLADGTDARTQIRAAFRSLLSPQRTGPVPTGGVDTIPFTLGDNDKIYVKGRINGGPSLDFQFDLGAGGSLIKKGSVPKVTMRFDGSIHLHNSDGDNVVPSSSANVLEIAGLRWEKVPFAVADNMTSREDGLIGNGLFQDKVVEIDYGRMVLAVHDAMPPPPPGWTRQEMVLDGGQVPFVRGSLGIDGAMRQGWLLLDTGAYTSILQSDRLSGSSKIADELRRMVGGRGRGVTLSVGGRAFVEPNYSARAFDGDAATLGLVGNDVLKRFDLILDNRGGAVYFRPNGHVRDAWRNPEYYVVRALAGVAIILVATAIWLLRRRRRR